MSTPNVPQVTNNLPTFVRSCNQRILITTKRSQLSVFPPFFDDEDGGKWYEYLSKLPLLTNQRDGRRNKMYRKLQLFSLDVDTESVEISARKFQAVSIAPHTQLHQLLLFINELFQQNFTKVLVTQFDPEEYTYQLLPFDGDGRANVRSVMMTFSNACASSATNTPRIFRVQLNAFHPPKTLEYVSDIVSPRASVNLTFDIPLLNSQVMFVDGAFAQEFMHTIMKATRHQRTSCVTVLFLR